MSHHLWDLGALVKAIQRVDQHLSAQAGRAVNVALTLRNWFIGLHIAEYELHGADRASYGENLLAELSARLRAHEISNSGRRQLYNYLSFYRACPQIVRTLPVQSRQLLPASMGPATAGKVRRASAPFETPAVRILNALSYSHLELLVNLDDPLRRFFYEIECLRGNWSARELKRQIGSLYYERSGHSRDKEKLASLAQGGAERAEPRLAIRDPHVFEFLGIKLLPGEYCVSFPTMGI